MRSQHHFGSSLGIIVVNMLVCRYLFLFLIALQLDRAYALQNSPRTTKNYHLRRRIERFVNKWNRHSIKLKMHMNNIYHLLPLQSRLERPLNIKVQRQRVVVRRSLTITMPELDLRGLNRQRYNPNMSIYSVVKCWITMLDTNSSCDIL